MNLTGYIWKNVCQSFLCFLEDRFGKHEDDWYMKHVMCDTPQWKNSEARSNVKVGFLKDGVMLYEGEPKRHLTGFEWFVICTFREDIENRYTVYIDDRKFTFYEI